MDNAGFEEVEKQRLDLEEHIVKLRKALRHWQTWEIEYEGLREEIGGLPNESKPETIVQVAREFQAELVNDKEIQHIVGGQPGPPRNQSQILNLLRDRLSYTSRNLQTIEKQLSDAQKKRNALLLAENPDHRDDVGLPLSEITEELDDDGNLIGSKVETPGSSAPQLLNILKKAGVQDVLEQDGVVTSLRKDKHAAHLNQKDESVGKTNPPELDEQKQSQVVNKTDLEISSTEQPECVVKPGATSIKDRASSSTSTTSEASSPSSPPTIDPIVESGRFAGTAKPRNTTGVVTADTQHPDDSPEEAALRREMLAYGFGEMGAIVAELDMEEGESSASFDNDDDDDEGSAFNEGGSDEEEELQDEHEMEPQPRMSSSYIKKMKHLTQKYSMLNAGPDADALPESVQSSLEIASDDVRLQRSPPSKNEEILQKAQGVKTSPLQHKPSSRATKPEKKKVTFSQTLDVDTEASKTEDRATSSGPQVLSLPDTPVKDTVAPRGTHVPVTPTVTTSGASNNSRKTSKFKQIRESTPQTPLFSHFTHAPELPSSSSPTTNYPNLTTNNSTSKSPGPPQIQTPNIIERQPHYKGPPSRQRTCRSRPRSSSSSSSSTLSSNDPDVLVDDNLHRREIVAEYHRHCVRDLQRQGEFVREEGEGERNSDDPVVCAGIHPAAREKFVTPRRSDSAQRLEAAEQDKKEARQSNRAESERENESATKELPGQPEPERKISRFKAARLRMDC